MNGVEEEKWSLGEKNGEEPEWKKRRMARDGQNKKEKNHARKWCERRYKNRNRGGE